MDAPTLLIELGLAVWASIVLFKTGWTVDKPRVLWGMTAGALLTNAMFMLILLPLVKSEAASQGMSEAVVYGFAVFRVVELTALVHLLTRLALSERKLDLPGGGFALLKPGQTAARTLLIGVAAGVVASAIGYGLIELWLAVGILDKPILEVMKEAGATWQMAFAGGIRNLFTEEVVTRLGAQTLLLYHLRRFRWAPWVALILSCLFFEIWHSGLEEIYFINFAASLPFAWSFQRYGYESAAIGHCVADWLAIALPLFLLA